MNHDFGATLSFDLGRPGRIGCTLPPLDVPEAALPPAELLRDELPLPELSQLDVVRYFTRLSQRNYSIDTGFYPLGSCSPRSPAWPRSRSRRRRARTASSPASSSRAPTTTRTVAIAGGSSCPIRP